MRMVAKTQPWYVLRCKTWYSPKASDIHLRWVICALRRVICFLCKRCGRIIITIHTVAPPVIASRSAWQSQKMNCLSAWIVTLRCGKNWNFATIRDSGISSTRSVGYHHLQRKCISTTQSVVFTANAVGRKTLFCFYESEHLSADGFKALP